MIREVYIDGQPIDINDGSAAGYIFTSPIFRDITKILSNRTTTYKVPKTTHNLTVFGLADNPDISPDFPYRKHTLEEYRDSILFIRGECTLLKVGDKDMELSVVWGSTLNILKLKDKKLRDMEPEIEKSIKWSDENWVQVSSEGEPKKQAGFLKIDFGRGVNDLQYIRPCVTVQKILDFIKSSESVQITYPDRFNNIFPQLWIPLLTNNAAASTWLDSRYRCYAMFNNKYYYDGNYTLLGLQYTSGQMQCLKNKENGKYTEIFTKEGKSTVILDFRFKTKLPIKLAGKVNETFTLVVEAKSATDDSKVYHSQSFPLTMEDDNTYVAYVDSDNFSFDIDADAGDFFFLQVYYSGNNNATHASFSLSYIVPYVTALVMQISINYKEVKPGDNYPLVPNLPDLKIVDFLKALMQMFGLFAHYDYNNQYEEDGTGKKIDVIRFLAIDDMYGKKKDAPDWTPLLVDTGKGRFNLSFTYGDYTQKNLLTYKDDDTVSPDTRQNADGVIAIDNKALPDEDKKLAELPFAPSDNVTDDNGNTYALIPLFDSGGGTQNVTDRVLRQNTFTNDIGKYLSAQFHANQFFTDKENAILPDDAGLLNSYYDSFRTVLNRPVLAECSVYLKDMDLITFREDTPVYIDGVYYMPIEVTVQPNSVAKCKLIKMPYWESKTTLP